MKAVISGVTGQDGSYLAEFLLEKGYEVIGFSRRVSVDTSERIKHLLDHPNFTFQEGDVSDCSYICNLLIKEKPDNFYNLAAQSHVATSFKQPMITTDINYLGVLNILNGIRDFSPETKIYQASTSEMFGSSFLSVGDQKFQNEVTPFSPQSPYAIAKLAAHHAIRLYRDSYGLFASAGILYNHESSRRGDKFVTKKITKWAKEFKKWKRSLVNQFCDYDYDEDYIYRINPESHDVIDKFPKLRLGNLDAYRDWGYAKEYVEAMVLMLEADTADDFVVATGETKTVREFLDEVFFYCFGSKEWNNFVVIDPEFYRPAEVDFLKGDSRKIKDKLGWEATTDFKQLVKVMINEDL